MSTDLQSRSTHRRARRTSQLSPAAPDGRDPVRQKRKAPLATRLRKWNNIIHRDLGYFFAGTVVLYAFSGLAVNHVDDWDPNFVVNRQEIEVDAPSTADAVTKDSVLAILEPLGERAHYRSHDFPTSQ